MGATERSRSPLRPPGFVSPADSNGRALTGERETRVFCDASSAGTALGSSRQPAVLHFEGAAAAFEHVGGLEMRSLLNNFLTAAPRNAYSRHRSNASASLGLGKISRFR